MKSLISLFAAAVFILVFLPEAAVSQSTSDDMPWLDGFTLIVLGTEDAKSMHRARNVIQAHGGKIAIMSPPSILMGWVPFELRDELIGRAGITDIFYTDVLPGEVKADDPQTRMMLNFFNAAVLREIQVEYKVKKLARSSDEIPMLYSDVLYPPEIDEAAYLENLRQAGLNVQKLKDEGLLIGKSGQATMGNSDTMTGTVSLTVFFVESDGSGSDPDLYTWTSEDMQSYINGVNVGLAWWSAQANNFSECWVAFFVRYYPGTDPRCQQWYEPVLHLSTTQSSWVNQVMINFGYTSGNYLTKVNAFNTWQRSTYDTDWAYSAFVAYNPPPAPDNFTDGYSAAAYWGGPYTYLLFRSFSWEVEEVFTHETGHIFYACDEYYSPGYGGCMSCGVCQNEVDNANCEYCNPASGPCMMKANTFTLCDWTPGHVGWFYSPCVPDSLFPPIVTSSSPPSQYQGLDATVTIVGADFLYGAFAEFGEGIIVNSNTVVGTETLLVEITVSNTAVPGLRDVIVKNRDLQADTLLDAFEVKQTYRHYSSPAGNNVFPYITPESAANSLEDAIETAGNGDSVFVDSTTISSISLNVSKGIELYGAWINNFTERDLSGGKTTLDLVGNVKVSGVNPAVIDGFILKNGTGSYSTVPQMGHYGGGIRIMNGNVTVANCEIQSCQATDGVDFSAGGGIFGYNSTVNIYNNYIWGNSAEYGGGIYLNNCSGAVDGNTISGNELQQFTTSPLGAGIYLEESPDISMSGNTITGNTGAFNGGGMYVKQSTGINVSGGVLSYNYSSNGGGGVTLSGSEMTLDGVQFLRNSSSIFGGAVSSQDTSAVTFDSCDFQWNSAMVGAGIYAYTGELYIRHSLFVGSDAAASGGAIYGGSLTAGIVIGNTMDRNISSSGAGGVLLVSSGIEVLNNIITNSGGTGVSCSGSPLPTLRYNDVWNSNGLNYDGCSPGEGSISTDPLFADTSAVDYHLAVHSPAIDAGDTMASYNDPDGSRGDMGWYGSHSFIMDQPSYPKNLEVNVISGNIVLNWDRNPEVDLQSYAVYSDTISGFVPSIDNFVQFVQAADTTVDVCAYSDTVYYVISAVDSSGYGSGYSGEVLPIPTAVPGEYLTYRMQLHQNVPNPFNPRTTIRYELDRNMAVKLTIYDVHGRLIHQLVDTKQGPGVFSTEWNGRNRSGESVSSGIYFYKLDAGGVVMTKKMVLLK